MAVIGPFGIGKPNQRPDPEQRDGRARQSCSGESPCPGHVLQRPAKREMRANYKLLPLLVTEALPRPFLEPVLLAAFQAGEGEGRGRSIPLGQKVACRALPLGRVHDKSP